MKLNRLEFLAMNNPVRAIVQERYELKILRSMTTLKNPVSVLEIGCGNGTGSKLIRKYFNPGRITCIDLDPRMIRIAERRNRDADTSFILMDASKLGFDDSSFDVVFDFGIIHHIPDWQSCIKEMYRVLKPGGELILEDMGIEGFTGGTGEIWRIISAHPYKTMYTADRFRNCLIETGFEILNFRRSNPFGMVKFFSLSAKKR